MILVLPSKAKFPLGSTVATANAIAKFSQEQIGECIIRHASGDWGDLCESDAKQNDIALESGGRIFSSYVIPEAGKLWIITEADRSVTTALLPEDY